jgi:hypothetical protein
VFPKAFFTINVGYIRGMRFVRTAIALSFLFCCFSSFSQSNPTKLKISVFDNYSKRALQGVNFIDPKISATFATDGSGYAEHDINWHDTLFIFFPGYKTVQFSLSDSAYRTEYAVFIFLNPFAIGLHDVVIKAPKTLEQIEEERKHLGITPKELERPEIQPFSSPISALYEVFSARAKEREKLKGQIAEDDRQKVFKELLNYYNERKLIDLPESHYNDFIKFCDLPADYLKNHSDYEIMKSITTYYKKYIRLSGLEK